MSHYFTNDEALKSAAREISFYFNSLAFTFTTDAGVFSKDHIDPATCLLLDNIPPLYGSLLDLGCGYGCAGIVLARAYSLSLTLADVNPRAIELTRRNCAANGVRAHVVESDCYGGVGSRFDTIIINPPIHAGKAVTYSMYDGAPAHLNPGGSLYVVTLKKHGAESTLNKLNAVFGACEVLYKKKGYYVLRCVLAGG